MNTQEALLEAVDEDFESDAPRLIYADWLEENGDPDRAEFIRLQCKEASGTPLSVDEDQRVWNLQDRHEKEWTQHLPNADYDVLWSFHRGFPEVLSIHVAYLLDNWPTWAQLANVRHLALSNTTEPLLKSFALQPWNARWRILELEVSEPKPWLHSWGSTSGFEHLMNSPQLANLDEFHVRHFELGDAEILALCRSRSMADVRKICLPQQHQEDGRLRQRFGKRLTVLPM